MRIARVESTALAVPLRQPFHWSSGAQLGANLVLWTVETDEGAIGYGESICEDPVAVEAYGRIVSEAFLGRSPGDVEAVLGELWRTGRWRFTPHWTNQIVAGIEVACWDALGKALGVPASTFLGGRVREEVDFMAFPQGETPEELAAHAGELAGEGYRVVYLKVGRAAESDEAAVAAVRQAIGPDALLRIDPNEAWDVPTAVERIRRLEPYGLDWVEQPVAAGNVNGLARVRRSVGTRIAADQAVFTSSELLAVLEREAADAIVLGHHECGGLWRLRLAASLAHEHGLPLNRHACMESAISTCAALQAMAAVPSLTLGNQVMHQLLAEPLVLDPPEPVAGRVAVPEGPGLGFELDVAAVGRAHERYGAQGPYRSVERTHAAGLETGLS
ncbi:MAG: mandelate racemase/muconate lactonizing enzyme family protein [Actinobacteria bacterium]|nr:mandelate racemase/muconate lactonizing enzyme family protein [Actinomycetota bacterium]